MFTGIIECLGTVKKMVRAGKSFSIEIESSFKEEIVTGESIAVNGVCLTVSSFSGSSFTADVTPETVRRSSLGVLRAGSPVNLERALKADGRFGGHIVSGHIDGTGRIAAFAKEENAVNIQFSMEKKLGDYMIEKGSVAVDGISLTVAAVKRLGSTCVVFASVIPHTWSSTVLCKKRCGDIVNIECDIVGKYIRHFAGGEHEC